MTTEKEEVEAMRKEVLARIQEIKNVLESIANDTTPTWKKVLAFFISLVVFTIIFGILAGILEFLGAKEWSIASVMVMGMVSTYFVVPLAMTVEKAALAALRNI